MGMRLIDAEVLKKHMCDKCNDEHWSEDGRRD